MADRIKGITIEIGGDTTGLNKALNGVNKEISSTQGQLKDVERLLKLDPTNTELLRQKQKLLADAVQGTKGKLDTLKEANKQVTESVSNYDAWKEKYDPIKKQIDETKKKLGDLKEQSRNADEQLANGEISQEKYDALQDEIKKTSTELKTLQKSAKEVSDEFGNPVAPEQYDALQREIAETEQQLKSLEDQAGKANTTLQQISAAGDKFQKVGQEIEGVGKKFLPVTAAVAGVGAAAVKTTADFDESMSNVSAISGATGEEFDQLRDKAREMGAETKFSASEAADAMSYMAMAGWKTDDMLNGISGIMNLAAASGADLATTSDIVTDALTGMGYTAADAGRLADVMAAASSNANTNVEMMG
ncbi:MAG: phage tail tape measure protein, partial [Enterocloster aldenensis]